MNEDAPSTSGPAGQGFDKLNDGEFEEALGHFDKAVALDPTDAQAFFGRALSWHHLGEIGNALSDYGEAIRLRPGFADAYLYRGSARACRGETEAAIADYDAALAHHPDLPRAYEYRAYARMRLGEFEAALTDLDEALRLAPDDGDVHRACAQALEEMDRGGEALEALDTALRIDPGDAAALQMRAVLRQERGDYDRAEEDLARAGALEASEPMNPKRRSLVSGLLEEHFAPESTDNLTITEREFPHRVRADLQRAVDRLFTESTTVAHFCGVLQRYSHEGLDFSTLVVPNPHDPARSVPPQYEEIDIGEDAPVRCLKNGLWLLADGDTRFAVLLAPKGHHGFTTGLAFQIAVVNTPEGTRITKEFFDHLADSVLKSESYRGKVLSLEVGPRFSGASSGLRVHRLRTVDRAEVILPSRTLELLERNILGFARQRARLAEAGLPTKKGVLFYGPPGTGKTHTIHYLAHALPNHTTLLITAEQVGLLGEYMSLARLLQPSVVVIEDADLIARDRNLTERACDDVLLHKLLNEMDGLRPDAEILFVLTTNRPEMLEAALASRPGRVDQAIEFPLPDAEGRAKLLRLYSRGLSVPDDVIETAVRKTEKVSASFIKELMRRAAQFRIEREETDGPIAASDIDNALEEMLFQGGALNRRLLGADVADD